jgi:HEAT repeat protein
VLRHRARSSRRLRSGLFGLLLSLGGSASAAELIWPSAIAKVEGQLASDDVSERRHAAQGLVDLPRAVARRLLPELFSDPDVEVRLAVADAALAVRLRDAGKRVVLWLSHPDARVRQAAAEVLAVLPTPDAVPALGRVLSDPQAEVRAQAATALGNTAVPEASLLLLSQLDDPDPDVRAAVIRALEELGDARAVVPLIGRIQERRVPIRRQAAAALGTLGDRRAVRALIVTLADGDASVRAAAATALGKLRAEDAIWSLGAVLDQEMDETVQSAVLVALGRISTSAGADVLVRAMVRRADLIPKARDALGVAGQAALPSLERCVLSPPSREAAEGCAAALGVIGGGDAQRLVEEALRRSAIGPVVALDALGRIGDRAALPVVLEYLSSARPAERRAAIDALGRLLDPAAGNGIAVEPLVLALSQARDARLERAALIALLGRTGSPRAIAELVPLAGASDEYLRGVTLEALGTLGPAAESDRVLLDALGSPSYPIRWTAAIALRRAGSAGAVAPLLQRIAGASSEQREAAAVALFGPLARTREPGVLSEVERLLASSSGPVRDALLEALGNVSAASGSGPLLRALPGAGRATRAKIAEALAAHPEASAEVVQLTRDAEAPVRANAAWSLGQIGSVEHAPVLLGLTRDSSAPVAASAVAALGLLGERQELSLGSELCALLDDERGHVRANALTALRLSRKGCDEGDAVRWILAHDPIEEARIAAAALLQAAPDDPAARDALARCARRDTSGQVALACSAPLRPVRDTKTSSISVLVAASSEASANPRVPFALVRADGLLRAGWADRRGSVWEAHAPSGTLRLALPAAYGE